MNIKKVKGGFHITHTTREVWGVDDDSETLPGMEPTIVERKQARAEAEGQELTAEMLKPKADISKKAGTLERESPLFYGKGDNPLLW